MFTVKHITVTGEELLKETEDVVCGFAPQASVSTQRELTFITRKGDAVSIDSGDVYVMNENGKTVATYHFGNPYAVGTTGEVYAGMSDHPNPPYMYPLKASSYKIRNTQNGIS